MATILDTHLARALRVTPNASQTRSKGPGHVGPLFGPGDATDFPLFARYGEGAYLYDDRGRKYLDCAGANAAIPLGYGFQSVMDAVAYAAAMGSLMSLPSVREAEISEQFLATCAPWAHQVRWVKTGSEATQAAYLIAKAATRRPVVLAGDWAYHGWHEWTASRTTIKYPRGQLWGDKGYITVKCPDGSSHTVANEAIAAIFVEPPRWELIDANWFTSIRAYCDRIGSLLIFDEMVYGLRWAKGGAAEYYDVQPDMSCFGKALGNGVPVACVCGPSHLMQHATACVSSTFGGEAIGLAAAEAVLKEYGRRDIIRELWMNGRALWNSFYETSHLELEGTAVHWRLPLRDAALDRALLTAARRGLLVHRASNNASAAMTVTEAAHAGHLLGEACVEAQRHRE